MGKAAHFRNREINITNDGNVKFCRALDNLYRLRSQAEVGGDDDAIRALAVINTDMRSKIEVALADGADAGPDDVAACAHEVSMLKILEFTSRAKSERR